MTLRNKQVKFKHDISVADVDWYNQMIYDLDSVASYIDQESKLYFALTEFLDDLRVIVKHYDGHISIAELESLKRFIGLICADGVHLLPDELSHLQQHIYTIDAVIEQKLEGMY